MKKIAKTVFFHIVSWKIAILAFFFTFFMKKMPKWRFLYCFMEKCRFGIFSYYFIENAISAFFPIPL
jgi:hypothetical protein